jgi:hypothetical protein
MSPEELKVKQIRVSERLGHSRPRVTTSYFGVFKKRGEKEVVGGAPAKESEASAIGDAVGQAAQTHDASQAGPGSPATIAGDVTPGAPGIAPTGLQGILVSYYDNAPSGRKRPDELNECPQVLSKKREL